ncbi:hypothetical protein [Sandaracinus amylolyticus]|uniref:Uncharacterized protein n=1 Tax=Sandaracinus amylolyticus TaxID=927083 RepID=A0A0F6YME5_9BACT|nr:hypothetical protein [Sandaracinus amylolyticus]AKF10945.1 hypothetical protein DB32_008094 [Sandaracinus amylolyticus]
MHTLFARACGLAAALLVLVITPRARAEIARPHLEPSPHLALAPLDPTPIVATAVIGGALLLGGYATTLVATWDAYDDDCPLASRHPGCEGPAPGALGWSLLPIIGPWAMLSEPGVEPALAIGMGVMQLAGAATLAIGLPFSITRRTHVAAVADGTAARLVVRGTF